MTGEVALHMYREVENWGQSHNTNYREVGQTHRCTEPAPRGQRPGGHGDRRDRERKDVCSWFCHGTYTLKQLSKDKKETSGDKTRPTRRKKNHLK